MGGARRIRRGTCRADSRRADEEARCPAKEIAGRIFRCDGAARVRAQVLGLVNASRADARGVELFEARERAVEFDLRLRSWQTRRRAMGAHDLAMDDRSASRLDSS